MSDTETTSTPLEIDLTEEPLPETSVGTVQDVMVIGPVQLDRLDEIETLLGMILLALALILGALLGKSINWFKW